MLRRKKNRNKLVWFLVLVIALVLLASQAISRYHEKKTAQSKIVVRAEKNITIIEGWNLDNIEGYLIKQGFAAQGLTKLKVKDYSADYSFLSSAPASASLEGYLFPDTYRVYQDASLDDIVQKMLANFAAKLDSGLQAEVAKQGKTVNQIVTMASIIEKEVSASTDRGVVSGIFWRRIKIGQPLESCATLAYVLGEYKAQYSQADTMVESPYNTYRHYGLTPGPISNPGLASLQAAIYPVSSNYNYFLTRPDTGETVYGRTFNEHLQNKAKYLK